MEKNEVSVKSDFNFVSEIFFMTLDATRFTTKILQDMREERKKDLEDEEKLQFGAPTRSRARNVGISSNLY